MRGHLQVSLALVFLSMLLAAGCQAPRTETSPAAADAARHTTGQRPSPVAPAREWRDLADDEAAGGHTLARHVGQTDDQLRQRLRREASLSVASTYTDRALAEATVNRALTASLSRVEQWERREGQRPNLSMTVEMPTPVGRSLRRGARAATTCASATVVMRWDERRERSFVLTSYPDCR